MPVQIAWRFCRKCAEMFFDGFVDKKGTCPADGQGHEASGFNFTLPHDPAQVLDLMGPDIGNGKPAPGQDQWRFCHKCHGMFFNGFINKGVCPVDQKGHEASGFNFTLPHDIGSGTYWENHWRFCEKCNAMFYDAVTTGHCPATRNGHVASGFDFCLPRDRVVLPVPRSGALDLWRLCTKSLFESVISIAYVAAAVSILPSVEVLSRKAPVWCLPNACWRTDGTLFPTNLFYQPHEIAYSNRL